MLPANVNAILEYITNEKDGWSLTDRDGVITFDSWTSATPQPTEQEITDTAASQPFLDWEAENGGDPALTARRVVKEALDEPSGKVLVALVKVLINQGIIPATAQQVRKAVIAKIAAGEVD